MEKKRERARGVVADVVLCPRCFCFSFFVSEAAFLHSLALSLLPTRSVASDAENRTQRAAKTHQKVAERPGASGVCHCCRRRRSIVCLSFVLERVFFLRERASASFALQTTRTRRRATRALVFEREKPSVGGREAKEKEKEKRENRVVKAFFFMAFSFTLRIRRRFD